MERRVIERRVIGRGKWIKLMEIDYSDNLKWEMVERTTKSCSGVDGIVKLNIFPQ